MSDDFSEKTEDATPRKQQEARDDGKIPKSQELTVAMLLLGTALILSTVVPSISSRMLQMMGSGLASAGDPSFSNEGAIRMVQTLGWKTLAAIVMVAASMAGVSLAIGMVQARGVISSKPLTPDFQRINPMANAKRMFGIQSVVELLKSLIKLVIVGFAIHSVLGGDAMNRMLATAQESPIAFLEVIRHYSVKMIMTAGLAYLGLAVADYLWQYFQYGKQLRMSKEEIKQESKNSDGDPHVRQRQRSMARNMARRQMFRDVPKADVVIANPTHRAIALRYDPNLAPAPIVLAMGERKVAERIKKIAFEHGIPVVENRPLAIALIKYARVGTMIPADLYLAVAEILAFVIRQRNERSGRRGYTAGGYGGYSAPAYRPISHLVGDQ